MAKKRIQKQETLRTLSHKIKDAKSIVFAQFKSLGVKDNEEIRRQLRAEDSEYLVTKKTLLNIALKENKIEDVNVREMEGQVAVLFGYNNEVAPAKVIDIFKKKKERADKINFLGGILEGRYINSNEVAALAKIPSRTELYAKLVGSMNAPVSGFVNALAGNMRNFVYVLNAIKDKK